jgi:tetratricopeptide (TPR) repeat protein
LAALVDHSLLHQRETGEGEPRLGMLEMIREFAGELLTASGEREDSEQTHAIYYLALAEVAEPALRGPEQSTWMGRLKADEDNLRVALHWAQLHDAQDIGLRLAGALWYHWFLLGRLSEGRSWLDALLVSQGDVRNPAARAKALVGASWLALSQGIFHEAVSQAKAGLALYEKLGDPGGRAAALTTLVCVALDQGDHVRARPLAEESLALQREQRDGWGICVSLNNLGYLAAVEGDYTQAAAYFEECLELSRAQGDRRGVALSLRNLGDVIFTQGDVAQAHELLAEALTLRRDMGWAEGTVEIVEAIARAVAAEGHPRRAARLLSAAAALRSNMRYPLRPAEQDAYDHTLAGLRDTLGAEAFDAAWAQGATLTAEQAVDAALTFD